MNNAILKSHLIIPKNLLENVSGVVKDLRVKNPEYANAQRFKRNRFYQSDVPKYFDFLKEHRGNYILPRNYPAELPADTEISMRKKLGAETTFLFEKTLRTYQGYFLDEHRSKLFNDIVLEVPCGHGKTVMAIYLAFLYQRRTIVIVPTIFLAKQWAKAIAEFTNATFHIYSSTDKEVPMGYDFTILSMDLFTVRDFSDEFFESIGHVILDEAHRVGAQGYLPILDRCPAYYRTALTATFRRGDGMDKILQYHFGELATMKSQFPPPRVYPFETGIMPEYVVSAKKAGPKFIEFMDTFNYNYKRNKGGIAVEDPEHMIEQIPKLLRSKEITKTLATEAMRRAKNCLTPNFSVLETYLSYNRKRKRDCVKLIQANLDAGRRILFISKRKEVLKYLYNYFSDYKPMLVISETNKMTPEQSAFMYHTCRLVLGVSQLAKEGLDIPGLETLILHLPIVDTEQAVGRIGRLWPGKKYPVCFYMKDAHPMMESVFRSAQKYIKINAELMPAISTEEEVLETLAENDHDFR